MITLISRTIIGMLLLTLLGCHTKVFYPEHATRPYPFDLHTTDTVDIQVFRDGVNIQVVNATARSYNDFDLWVNQRYVRHIEALPVGQSLTLSLWDFYDERGERPIAGGFWRTQEPTRVRLVEIQTDPQGPMIGLIAIRGENEDEDR